MEVEAGVPHSQIVPVPNILAENAEQDTHVRELVQVIEAAESAIRNQMQENEQLKLSLKVTEWELQNRRMEAQPGLLQYDGRMVHPGRLSVPPFRGGHLLSLKKPLPAHGLAADEHAMSRLQEDMESSLVLHSSGPDSDNERNVSQGLANGGNGYSNGRGVGNGVAAARYGPPHLDTSSAAVSSSSISPGKANNFMAGMHPVGLARSSDVNYNTSDVYLRTARMYEEENSQLRSRLVDASIKEAQLLSEKRILERRVSELRLAYDQQQQGLVDAASKALSYRQDVIEENIRLTYALQAAERDRSVYLTSLLPVLSEFDLQPPVTDAHSIVSAVKVLVQHLRSECSLNEGDHLYQSSIAFPPAAHLRQTPYQSPAAGQGMEIVPQSTSLPSQLISSPTSQPQRSVPWDSPSMPQSNSGTEHSRHGHYLGQDHAGASVSPPVQLSSPARGFADHHDGDHSTEQEQETFVDRDLYDPPYHEKEEQEKADADRRLLLPTLEEEPNASASEDEDPLPAIDGLNIIGDAVLGGKLTACGLSINGTSLCIFQWVRHLKNGAEERIEGAAQPEYIVTADDADCRVAIECVPMDERNRRGVPVTVFANGRNWITCDADMQDQIDGFVNAGLASFDLLLLVDGSGDERWEQAVLSIKRNGFEIRKVATRRAGLAEKFSAAVSVTIPVGNLTQCILTSASSRQWSLDLPDSRTRDTLVLTFRAFLKAAIEGKRGRRKVLWGRMVI